jgi:hypothetical protein
MRLFSARLRPSIPTLARCSLQTTRQIPRHAPQAWPIGAQTVIEVRQRGWAALALLFSPHGAGVGFVRPRIILRIAPC